MFNIQSTKYKVNLDKTSKQEFCFWNPQFKESGGEKTQSEHLLQINNFDRCWKKKKSSPKLIWVSVRNIFTFSFALVVDVSDYIHQKKDCLFPQNNVHAHPSTHPHYKQQLFLENCDSDSLLINRLKIIETSFQSAFRKNLF